jgi:histidyl-tRNA synthetase
MQKGALPGFRDFYPEDLALRAHIFEVWRRVATRYGFEEYDGPPLESLELYTAKSGEEIVHQLYEFRDKGDRHVALRPEMTPTLARMVAARANGLKKPIRWFSIPQLFRYERKQRGRLREHFQFNCDLIGESGPVADAEVVALSIDVMREFGLTASDFRVRLSDRRLVQLLLRQAHIGAEYDELVFRVLDRFEKSPPDELVRLLEPALEPWQIDRVLSLPSIKGLDGLRDAFGSTPAGHLGVGPLFYVVHCLHRMGLGDFVDVDFTIVRGLAYYTGTVFELFDSRRSMRAICGGGRYDSLTRSVGGVEMPAVGFGMGDVVLGELLREAGRLPPMLGSVDVFVVASTEEDVGNVMRLAHQLRSEGLRTEYALSPQTMTKQLKLAESRGARFIAQVGPEERANETVQIRDVRMRRQISVPVEAVARAIRSAIDEESSRHQTYR